MIDRALAVNVLLIALGSLVAALAFPAGALWIGLLASLAIAGMVALEAQRSLARRKVPAPSYIDLALERRVRSDAAPADLGRLERIVGYGVFSQRDFDHLLRPRLVRLIEFKLLAEHGVDVRVDPRNGRSLLPSELHPLMDPDESLCDPRGRIEGHRIEQWVTAIEGL